MLQGKITSGIRFFLIGLMVLGVTVQATAGSSQVAPSVTGPLTWEQAIRTAVERHPLIKAADYEALASQAVVKQIESANYPQLTGVYANSGGNTRVVANLSIGGSLPKPTNYLTSPGLRADFLITDFGHTAHRILSQQSMAAATQKAALAMKALTILNVEQAYLNCLKQQRLVEIAQEVLRERNLIRQQTEALYRRQLRSKLDLDFASVEVNRAETVLIKSQNDLSLAYAALHTAMGIPVSAARVLQLEQIESAVSADTEESVLIRLAMTQRPELQGSREHIQAAEEAVKAAKAMRFGSVSAIGTLSYTWWGHEERTDGRKVNNPGAQLGWYGVGVTADVPLYAGGRIEAQIDEADARRGETEAGTRSLANDIVLQVMRAYFSRLTAAQHIEVAKEKVAHAREALTLARERYKAGLSSIIEVTTATAGLLSAEVELTESQYEYRASDAALAYSTGSEYGRY
ncbi:putative Outer membrane protein TolC [Nitrospira sp. KM1]|uniref:TolC family protein n=1 Tax=Nitrospira sp. KM1 TaxID=1936990 RepID=UPI0013A74438|nr:TolC family protein [Nitrospira sp. KM1]BCA56168.1 putative Outer membrane protein TolC [Nitrospira sp. KM1]